MDKCIYDNNNDLWYELQGDYYIPCLTVPEDEQQLIGMWGRRHLRYIREYCKGLYNSLIFSRRLNGYLAALNDQAEDMFFRLVKELAEKEVKVDIVEIDVEELLKAFKMSDHTFEEVEKLAWMTK